MIEQFEYLPTQTSPFTRRVKIKRRLWFAVELLLFRPTPWFLYKWRVLLIRFFGGRVSWLARISSSARVDCPWNLVMHDYSSAGDDAWLYALDRIEIGRYACVGQYSRLITGSHMVRDRSFALVTKPIILNDGCWLAAGVTVLPGVEIGAYTVVGASSLVSKSLGPNTIAVGSPCRVISERFKEEKK